jgi:hypothetical protein
MDPLRDIFNKMDEAQKTASKSLEEVEPAFRPGWAVLVRDAKDALAKLKADLPKVIANRVTRNLVVGPKPNLGRTGKLVFDGNELFRRLAELSHPILDPRRSTFEAGTYIRIKGDFYRFCEDHGLTGILDPQPNPQDYGAAIDGLDGLTALVKRMVVATNPELNGKFLEQLVCKTVLEHRLDYPTLNVVVYNLTNDDAANLERTLFPGRPLKEKNAAKTVEEESTVAN